MSRLVASFLLVAVFTSTAVARPFASPPPDRPDAPVVAGDPVEVVSRAAVRAALVERRAQSIALFRDYWRGGVYPHNTFTDGELNVWLDAEGRLCAAATIIANSGLRAEVLAQAELDNFIKLADVEDGWLMDWMLTSGLTQEELVLIQRPFVGKRPTPELVEPAPAPEPVADPFAAIDEALRAKYTKIDRALEKQAKASLELAVDRLMARPALAAELVASTTM